MSVLLVTGGPQLPSAAIERVASAARAAGRTVMVVGLMDEAELRSVADGPSVVALGRPVRSGTLVGRVAVRLHPGPLARQLWSRAQRSAELRDAASAAGLLVALDAPAVRTVWRLARSTPGAVAVLGADAAARAISAQR